MKTDFFSGPRNPSTAQYHLFTLFGEVITPYNEGAAWTHEILYLLDLLGISERAGRTALARMKKKGWVDSEKVGRRSRYQITPQGQLIVNGILRHLSENPVENWDGRWHLAIYSLPERMRGLRNDLRNFLLSLGFGQLAPGTWIGAHDRTEALAAFAGEMGIRPYVSLFAGRQSGLISDEEIVARSWDLKELAAGYEKYIAAWQPRLVGGDLHPARLSSPEDRFWARFFLTVDFFPLARRDPNLPSVLLPQDWPGYTARRLLTYYRVQFNEGLPAFFTSFFNR